MQIILENLTDEEANELLFMIAHMRVHLSNEKETAQLSKDLKTYQWAERLQPIADKLYYLIAKQVQPNTIKLPGEPDNER